MGPRSSVTGFRLLFVRYNLRGRGATKEAKEAVRRVNWELVTVAVGVSMLVLAILLRVLGVY